MKAEHKGTRRVLLYADTPFQVFAELCWLLSPENDALFADAVIDLVIHDQSDHFKSIVPRLEALGIFQNVWLLPGFNSETKRLGTRLFSDILMRYKATRRKFFEQYPMLKNRKFDLFVFSAPQMLLSYIQLFCRSSRNESILVEDGVGTYNGEMFSAVSFLDDILVFEQDDDIELRIKRFVKKGINFITRGTLKCHPTAMYLFDIPNRVRKRYKNIELRRNQIPIDEKLDMLKQVFPLNSGNLYQNNRFVYLATADLDEEAEACEMRLFNMINSRLNERLLLRSHPRETKTFATEKPYLTDESGDLWEMLIADGCVNDDSVLFSICSTAQLNPKLIFGIEPYIVFLYDLLPEGSRINKSIARKTSDEARELYRDKTKVHVPSSFEEVISIINKFNLGGNTE